MQKITKAQKIDVAKSIIAKLDALEAKRKVWQVEFDRTNKGLYGFMATTIDIYYEIKGTKTEKQILEGIKTVLKARNIKVQESTPVLTLLVRYVFNPERRRAHCYARALRVAISQKVTAAAFPGWVEKFGGIEEVANTHGATAETLDKREKLLTKVEEVKTLLEQQIDTPLATVGKTLLVNAADTAEYTLLIGKMQANGKTKVLSVVPDATSAMIEAAIKKIATALIEYQERVAQENAKQAVRDAKFEAANSAELLAA